MNNFKSGLWISIFIGLFWVFQAGALGIQPQVLSAGVWHTCGINSVGTVVCWGNNGAGQSTPPPATQFTQLSAGGEHSCGIINDGRLGCWGNNSNGQITPPEGIFTQVGSGFWHNCAIRDDGNVSCWGWNRDGQSSPKSGSFTQVSSGYLHTCGLQSDGTIACWGGNDSGQATPPAGTFTQISAGYAHNCGIRSDGTVACWGINSVGQTKSLSGQFSQISAGGGHSCGIRNDGSVACWGGNENGQSTPPPGIFIRISAGYLHTCGLKNDGSVVCWGSNYNGERTIVYGQATPPSGIQISEAPSNLTIATSVSPTASGSITCNPNPVGFGGSSSCKATATAGYSFVNWSGACSGISSMCSIDNVTVNKNVVALFNQLSYYSIGGVSNPPAGGSVVCSPNPISSGGSATCTASINPGYSFESWSGDCSGSILTCSLNNVTASKSVTAVFKAQSSSTPTVTGSTGVNCVASFTLDGKLHLPYVGVLDVFGGKALYEADLLLLPSFNPLRFQLADARKIQDAPSCAAIFTPDGKLHIPYVSVPDALGGLAIYEGDLQLLPLLNPLSFELLATKTTTAPQSNDFQFGTSKSYVVSGGANTTISDPLSGNIFRFPKGGNGKLTITPITTVPEPGPFEGTSYKIEYTNKIDSLQVVIPHQSDELAALWLWNDPGVSTSEARTTTEIWEPLLSIEDNNSQTVFDIQFDENAAASAKKYSRISDDSMWFVHESKIKRDSPIRNKLAELHSLAETDIGLILNYLPDNVKKEVQAKMDGELKLRDSEQNQTLFTSLSFYSPYYNLRDLKLWPVVWPHFVWVVDKGLLGKDSVATYMTVAHEVGHYMSHVFLGNQDMFTLNKQSVTNHDIGMVHPGRPMLEEYAFFSDYTINSRKVKGAALRRVNELINREDSPSTVDWPSKEEYGVTLLAALHEPFTNDFSGYPQLIQDEVLPPLKLPETMLTLNDLWGILAVTKPLTVDDLLSGIRKALVLKGNEDKLWPILESSGWSYHGHGRVVDENNQGVPFAKLQAVVKVPSQGSDEYFLPYVEKIVADKDGNFVLERMFPGDANLIRVWKSTAKAEEFQDFAFPIDPRTLTSIDQTLGDLKLNSKKPTSLTIPISHKGVSVYSSITKGPIPDVTGSMVINGNISNKRVDIIDTTGAQGDHWRVDAVKGSKVSVTIELASIMSGDVRFPDATGNNVVTYSNPRIDISRDQSFWINQNNISVTAHNVTGSTISYDFSLSDKMSGGFSINNPPGVMDEKRETYGLVDGVKTLKNTTYSTYPFRYNFGIVIEGK